MNDFHRKLREYTGTGEFDLDKGDAVAREVAGMYEAKMRRARLQFWWRFAVAAAIAVYGAIGVKYNTGWYAQWALFTALVGVNLGIGIVLWYWQLDTKLGLLRELKQLRLEVSALAEGGDSSRD